jgi:hypothetical protein
MKQSHRVRYELFDTLTDDRIVTEDRGQAIEYFRKGWVIAEHHLTTGQPSANSVVQLEMSITWNEESDFAEEK